MSNYLIESAARQLGRMSKYLNEATEGPDQSEEERAEWLPRTLHDFLFHLSGPSDPTGEKSGNIQEATVFDIKRGDRPGGKGMVGTPEHLKDLPKSRTIVQQSMAEGLHNRNIHKSAGEFGATFSKLESEHPSETRKKLGEAKKAFQQFAQARGFKAGTAPKMLRGNMKTEKSSGENVLTTGLNLAPHSTSGLHDTCPNASEDCRKNCLGTQAGGNRQYPDTALSSKILRTHFIVAHPEHAARLVDSEISAHKKAAKKKGMSPGVRMNITSDISWEHHAPKMFERHSDVQFYDYTKLHNRVLRQYAPPSKTSNFFNSMGHPKNYHLTLSHTGTGHSESNDKHVANVLDRGGVAAMVFQRGKGNKLPTHVEDVSTGKRYPVANGDDDDNTFDRHATLGAREGEKGHGVVSGLMLKGVKNEDAGKFANKVDDDGIVRINKPK